MTTCEKCGRPAQETLKHKGLTIRVCRQCGNVIREERRPKQAKARAARQEQARAARAAPPVKTAEDDDDLPSHVGDDDEGEGES